MSIGAREVVKCFVCNSDVSTDLSTMEGCKNCKASYTNALGIDAGIIKELFNFCKNECANPLLAFDWCTFQISNKINLRPDGMKLGRSALYNLDVDYLRQSKKCDLCKKDLLGFPNNTKKCNLCFLVDATEGASVGVLH